MVTPRKRGGYVWKQEMGRALRTNNTARQAIRRILDERPGPTLTALYLAEAALALGENLEALLFIQAIEEPTPGVLCDQG